MKLEERLVLLRDPDSVVSESFRSLRTNLHRSLGQGVRGLLVVSPWGGDGKSMVCANLAASLAQVDMQVALVDGDLRRPTLTSVFDCRGRRGLTDFLHDGQDLEGCLVSTPVDGLSFLPAGTRSENAADLLGRATLAAAFRRLKEKVDCVLVDTPPLAPCKDALLMAAHADAALMVINPRHWEGEPETRIRQTLEEHQVRLLGVVLNGSDDRDPAYYGYAYRYAYGSSPPKKGRSP